MAQANIKRVMRRMYKAANSRYARRGVDKMPQKVLVTTENLFHGIKHSYGLAQKRKSKLPFVDDAVLHRAARYAMINLRRHLRTPSDKHAIRFSSTQVVFFTQATGRDTEPFRVVKRAAIRYLEASLKVEFGEEETESFNLGLSRQHGTEQNMHGDPITVGMAQLAKSMESLSRTNLFGGFVGSEQAKKLSDKFGVEMYFETSGRGRRRKYTIKESVEVGLSLMSSKENPAGGVPADWKNIKPELQDAIFEWAQAQNWYTMSGSPSMEDDHTDMVLDSVTADISKGKHVKSGTKKRRRKAKDKAVTAKKPLTKKVRRSKKGSGDLKGSESEYSLHNIIAMINIRLHDTLMDNMTSPRLVYRTGRFASTVTANATTTAKGNLSIGYNYMTNPYAVFAPGGKMYTRDRDPRLLIEMSIRQIATELAVGRYGVRRS